VSCYIILQCTKPCAVSRSSLDFCNLLSQLHTKNKNNVSCYTILLCTKICLTLQSYICSYHWSWYFMSDSLTWNNPAGRHSIHLIHIQARALNWRWLLHKLSKHQSPVKVFLRTPVTQTIIFNQSMLSWIQTIKFF